MSARQSPRYRSPVLIALLSVVLPLRALSQDRPQPQQAVWSATNVAAIYQSEISVFSGSGEVVRAKPRSGERYLEIRASLAARIGTPAVSRDSAFVLLGGDPTPRVRTAGIAIAGRDGSCVYSTLNLSTGGVSETVTITDADGAGYRLYRGQEGGPVLIALAKNPNPTCLLFVIQRSLEPQSVTFGDARVPLSAASIAAAIAPPPETLVSIVPGDHHTCGLTNTGRALCWGWNDKGQLGDGSLLPSPTPVEVRGGYFFTQLTTANGNNTCGLTRGGLALCWGEIVKRNALPAELAAAGYADTVRVGFSENMLVPSMPGWIPKITQLASGHGHTCALTGDGAVFCWGSNTLGQLGDGSRESRPSPKRVGTMNFTFIATGSAHTCALNASGRAYCWGWNRSGQLGDGTTADRTAPVPVSGELAFTQLAAGQNHTCGMTGSGAAFCWGSNENGELGTGEISPSQPSPVAVAGGVTFTQLSAGGAHTCALGSDGVAYCWGFNGGGQLGQEEPREWPKDQSPFMHIDRRPLPAPVPGLTLARLAAGGSHTCGISTKGRAYCWGWNQHWQLGDPATPRWVHPSPVQVRLALPQDPSRTGTLRVGSGENKLKECILVSVQRRGEEGIVLLNGEDTRNYSLPEGDYIVTAVVGRNDSGEHVTDRFLLPVVADHVYRVGGTSRLVTPGCIGSCKARIMASVRDTKDREDVDIYRLP
jgi:alpha-tubulin suppressor-like RCC1 family protein